MSKPKIFKVRNRLRAAVFDGGGKCIGAALADSESNLAGLAEACDAQAHELLRQIEREFGPNARRDEADPAALYRLIMDLIDVSGHSGVRGVPETCSSFCDLLELSSASGVWDWPAVDVHIAALQCMAPGTSLPEADRLKIASGLLRLLRHRAPAAAHL